MPAVAHRWPKLRSDGWGRSLAALLVVLTLFLNSLLPVMATAIDTDQLAEICLPEGYLAIHLNGDGVPTIPSKHECSGCAIHHGFGVFVGVIPAANIAVTTDNLSVQQPLENFRRAANNRRSSNPRGPPHLV